MRIRVDTDQLRVFSTQLQQAALDLDLLSRRVEGAFAQLDWEARNRAGVEDLVAAARNRAQTLVGEGTSLARNLNHRAQMFEGADQEALQQVEALRPIAIRLTTAAIQSPLAVPPPIPTIDQLLRLGNLLPLVAPGMTAATLLNVLRILLRPPAATPAPQSTRPPANAPSTPSTVPTSPKPIPGAGAQGGRSAVSYAAMIDSFDVESTVKYLPNHEGKGWTYCNIFVIDVTKALGAKIPHLLANDMFDWLREKGPQFGWRAVTPEEAQAMANQGHPTVAAYQVNGPHGHVAMVRPGEFNPQTGPMLAQAGRINSNSIAAERIFPNGLWKRGVTYYVHG